MWTGGKLERINHIGLAIDHIDYVNVCVVYMIYGLA